MADDRETVVVEAEDPRPGARRRARPPASPGTAASQRRRASSSTRLPTPTTVVSGSRSGTLPRTAQAFSKKLPSPFSTPSSAGTWPMMIVSARPMMKPLSTGSEMNDARKPSRKRPASDRDEADGERERGGQGEVLAGVGAEVADDARRQRRGRRHRRDDQVPRAAEQRVEQQRRDGGVEADDGRHAGDPGVRQRLGDEHRPDGEAGDHVAAQPGRTEAAEGRARRRCATPAGAPDPVARLVTRTTQPGRVARPGIARFR